MSERFEREQSEVLSPAGRARREEILDDALRVADRRRRAKIFSRAAVVLIAAGIFSSVFLVGRGRTPAPVAHVLPPAIRETAPLKKSPAEIAIVRVKTDPTLLEQMRAPPQTPTWKELSDDELLKQLAAAGKPAGIAYVDGKAELLYR